MIRELSQYQVINRDLFKFFQQSLDLYKRFRH